ncbi:hypothetical protein [[Pseudomonas] boreopolis]|uniref:Uncharacterized protein n=1 Tax=Xanthomonas boreopolis TaxID=86183 RepID=A0A919F7H2_9XANT|nr:hypothetical protein GCM10009090_18010 [[Pseudomonas] boreopolis]
MSCVAAREVLTDSKIKVEENGRVAIFINSARSRFHRTRVDGGIVKNKVGADYVVTKEQVGSVVVELKGVDIEHAVLQIGETMLLLKACMSPSKPKSTGMPAAGLIICSKYPKADTAYQKKVKAFVAQHKAPIHCVSGRGEFEIERVLRFDGPR